MSHDPLLLVTAIEVVLRAGEIQLKRQGTALKVEKKGEIDLVTEADLEVEEMFRQVVGERFPDHSLLAEEGGGSGAARGKSGCCWVFDPIDGTTNYAHGLPVFCASLGLEVDGQTVVAAVYDPTRRELFTAERGEGAFLNGRRLRTSTTEHLADALLVTGFPYDIQHRLAQVVGLFGEFIRTSRAVRRLGSAALDLCYVAAGRLDGFWEQGLKPWDTTAGALLVAEAGGLVSDIRGGVFDAANGEIVASNGPIHDEMLETIRSYLDHRSRNRTH